MNRSRRILTTILAALFMTSATSAVATTAAASDAHKIEAKRRETAKRMNDFAKYITDTQAAPDHEIPADLFTSCKGILIFRQFKAGFGIGGHGGGGVALLRRADGSWSPPAFFQEGGGSVGFQIGGQKVEAIFLIMNEDGMNMLIKTRFNIGVDASAAAGPVGRDAAAKVGPGTAILSYSRAKGLFAGAKLEGGVMIANDEANAALYGPGMGLSDILLKPDTPMPAEAANLVAVLTRYAGPLPTEDAPAQPEVVQPQQPAPVATPAPAPAPIATPVR